MMRLRFLFSIFLLSAIVLTGFGQEADHWETIIYSDDDWKYRIGSADIPLEWIEQEFDSSQWPSGPGGFGYGDDDDNTILNDVLSVYIIRNFEVFDKEVITNLILHADYDDGFVAYLNGEEVARKNLGTPGVRVFYNESSDDYIEPNQSQGLLPEAINIDPEVLSIGDNTLAIQVHNFGANSSDLSSNFFLSVGISNDSSFYNAPPDWFVAPYFFDATDFETSLPILKVTTTNGVQIVNNPRVKAHLGVIYNGFDAVNLPTDAFNNYDGAISIEHRGTSSLWFDKKGYGFETQNEDGTNNNVELLGMPEENDWVLHGPYSDKSLLRNVLTYHIGNLTGRYAPRTQLCELFVNDQYEGVYVLTEKIKQDKNRVDIAKLTELDNEGDELTGGYIIQVDRNPDNIPGLGWVSEFPDYKFFAFVEPKDDDITNEQKSYIKEYMFNFESAMDAPNYESTYKDYIDVASLVDYFLVTEIGKHIDAFKLSFYLYKDKDSNGGKLHFGPQWDFNLGYGNFDFECSPDYDGWAYEFPDCGSWHPFWARKLVDIPNVQHLSKCRWQELREGPFNTLNLLSFIDSKVAEMGTAVDRNFGRWPNLGQYVWPNDFIGDTHKDEVNFLKTWLANRLNWMDDNLPGNCDSYVSGVFENTKAEFNLYPNPASKKLNVSYDLEEEVILEIYSANEQLIKSEFLFPNSKNAIDIATFKSGLYTVLFKSAKNGQTIFADKLIVF